ncbi:hypothetical protein O5833_27295 [Escherichia coli]|nr:hypothetical protein [Escherichia coli]
MTRHEQYFQMHFLNSGQIELQLDDHRYSVEAAWVTAARQAEEIKPLKLHKNQRRRSFH